VEIKNFTAKRHPIPEKQKRQNDEKYF